MKPDKTKSPPYGPRFITTSTSEYDPRPLNVAVSRNLKVAPATRAFGINTSELRRSPVELTFPEVKSTGSPFEFTALVVHWRASSAVVSISTSSSAGKKALPVSSSRALGFCFASASALISTCGRMPDSTITRTVEFDRSSLVVLPTLTAKLYRPGGRERGSTIQSHEVRKGAATVQALGGGGGAASAVLGGVDASTETAHSQSKMRLALGSSGSPESHAVSVNGVSSPVVRSPPEISPRSGWSIRPTSTDAEPQTGVDASAMHPVTTSVYRTPGVSDEPGTSRSRKLRVRWSRTMEFGTAPTGASDRREDPVLVHTKLIRSAPSAKHEASCAAACRVILSAAR